MDAAACRHGPGTSPRCPPCEIDPSPAADRAQHRPKGWTITRARRALIVPAHGRSVRLPEGETLDEGERFMTRRLASLILCGGVAVLGSACATKSFVQKQVSATESKLTQQMTATETNLAERAAVQETKLRETADRAGESRQAIDVADQRLNGLDLRVGDVSARTRSAETRADLATGSARDVEARLSQRLASRNSDRHPRTTRTRDDLCSAGSGTHAAVAGGTDRCAGHGAFARAPEDHHATGSRRRGMNQQGYWSASIDLRRTCRRRSLGIGERTVAPPGARRIRRDPALGRPCKPPSPPRRPRRRK